MHFILNIKNATFFLALTIILFAGCNKGTSSTPFDADDNGGYASDASRIELYTDDAISICDEAGTFYNGKYLRTTTDSPNTFGICGDVSTDTVTSSRTLIIRFKNTTCLDGRTRNGAIIVQYAGEYTDSLQPHYITFDNYFVNGIQLTGSIITTRIDTTVIGNWYYQVQTLDTLISTVAGTPNSYTIWQATLVRQWVTGFQTNTRGDDVFSISGWGQLTRANSHIFTFNISTPLEFALDCNYCESGVAVVTGYNGQRTLNYGNGYGSGACDNRAQLNIKDTTSGVVHTYQIALTP